MPRTKANGIELDYAEAGTGETVVLVHGSWSDRNNWLPVTPALAESFRVVAYDRRGHGASGRDAVGTRRDQEDDLAGLIESLGGSAAVIGTSFGASIALGLACRRPELFSSLVVHEPPLVSIAAEDPDNWEQLGAVGATIADVTALVEHGNEEAAARKFVEEVALGPGAWELLPPPLRRTMVDSAGSFVAEQQDPDWAGIDLAALASFDAPVLISDGTASPPWFGLITRRLAAAVPAETHTYEDAGHAPHQTHPEAYLSVVGEFLSRVTQRASEPLAPSHA